MSLSNEPSHEDVPLLATLYTYIYLNYHGIQNPPYQKGKQVSLSLWLLFLHSQSRQPLDQLVRSKQ